MRWGGQWRTVISVGMRGEHARVDGGVVTDISNDAIRREAIEVQIFCQDVYAVCVCWAFASSITAADLPCPSAANWCRRQP